MYTATEDGEYILERMNERIADIELDLDAYNNFKSKTVKIRSELRGELRGLQFAITLLEES